MTHRVMQEELRNTLLIPDGMGFASLFVDEVSGISPVSEADDGWVSVDCRSMWPKRRREFIAGRICASRALEQIGASCVGCLGRTADGLPAWPVGWVGCISHSASWAVAAVAKDCGSTVLGIDIQKLFDAQTEADVRPLVASDVELRILGGKLDIPRALTLIFSAKETLYKALFPKQRTFQDFCAAELTALAPGYVQLSLTRDWGEYPWVAGARVQLRYTWFAGMVMTLLYLPCSCKSTCSFFSAKADR